MKSDHEEVDFRLMNNIKVPSLLNSIPMTDSKKAEDLGSCLFDNYNKSNQSDLGSAEVGAIMKDIYASIGVSFEPTEKDIREYSKILGGNESGKISRENLKKFMTRMLGAKT